ncbi:MAG TPA: DUF898 family protein [Myxococcales bacterium]|jgi:uncharacterized membrane protein YjgN (DUF898 family)
MDVRLTYQGQGAQLFVKFLVGGLLSAITLGIYLPWFMVTLLRFVADNTTMKTSSGEVKLSFDGTGGELFVKALVGGLLTSITLGIYSAWFIADLSRWHAEHLKGVGADGSTYSGAVKITGKELFITVFVGMLLTGITFGIYYPWFACKLQKVMLDTTEIVRGGQTYGKMTFTGAGGDLFVTFLVGALLTSITLGIYGAWFQVKMMRFFSEHTLVTVEGQTFAGGFDGEGAELFVLNLVGGLLTSITLGIYGAWYFNKVYKFNFDHASFRPGAALPAVAAAA